MMICMLFCMVTCRMFSRMISMVFLLTNWFNVFNDVLYNDQYSDLCDACPEGRVLLSILSLTLSRRHMHKEVSQLKPCSGSVVFQVDRSSEEDAFSNIKGAHPENLRREASKTGTIGCLLHDVTDHSIWLVTCCRPLTERSQSGDLPVESGPLWSEVVGGSGSQPCLVGERYWYAQDSMQVGKVQKYIDLLVCPLYKSTQYLGLYTTTVPTLKQVPQLYIGKDHYLLHRRVCKTGSATGVTQGVIQAVNLTHTHQGRAYSGVFAVVATRGCFAKSGDIGALVVDPHSGEGLGLVCDVRCRLSVTSEWCDDVTLCVRLDLCLMYAQYHWGIVLTLNPHTHTRLPRLHLLSDVDVKNFQRQVNDLEREIKTQARREHIQSMSRLGELRHMKRQVRECQQIQRSNREMMRQVLSAVNQLVRQRELKARLKKESIVGEGELVPAGLLHVDGERPDRTSSSQLTPTPHTPTVYRASGGHITPPPHTTGHGGGVGGGSEGFCTRPLNGTPLTQVLVLQNEPANGCVTDPQLVPGDQQYGLHMYPWNDNSGVSQVDDNQDVCQQNQRFEMTGQNIHAGTDSCDGISKYENDLDCSSRDSDNESGIGTVCSQTEGASGSVCSLSCGSGDNILSPTSSPRDCTDTMGQLRENKQTQNIVQEETHSEESGKNCHQLADTSGASDKINPCVTEQCSGPHLVSTQPVSVNPGNPLSNSDDNVLIQVHGGRVDHNVHIHVYSGQKSCDEMELEETVTDEMITRGEIQQPAAESRSPGPRSQCPRQPAAESRSPGPRSQCPTQRPAARSRSPAPRSQCPTLSVVFCVVLVISAICINVFFTYIS